VTWSDFFLICFLVGFVLSLLSFMAGALHLPIHHHGAGHLFGHHAGGGHGPAHAGGAHGAAAASAGTHLASGDQRGGVSPINFSTATAFLAWFGGVGYLLTHYYAATVVVALSGGLLSGMAGATAVFWFFAKVMLPHETLLDPADFDMVGVLGTVTSPIRADGVGEIGFSQGGTRRASPARSDGNKAIEIGVEVIVSRYEKGVAFVRPFDEMV
jgi:hypothetical protein